MMKTPEEIKYGLASHGYEICDKRCAYHDWRGTGYDCCSMLCQDAHTYIEQLEAQIPRWIPVEEMMPEKMKIVLVFKRRTAHFIWSDAMWNIETDWCGEDGWSKNPHNGCFAVTHWMPLPEPPEEAKTNG